MLNIRYLSILKNWYIHTTLTPLDEYSLFHWKNINCLDLHLISEKQIKFFVEIMKLPGNASSSDLEDFMFIIFSLHSNICKSIWLFYLQIFTLVPWILSLFIWWVESESQWEAKIRKSIEDLKKKLNRKSWFWMKCLFVFIFEYIKMQIIGNIILAI